MADMKLATKEMATGIGIHVAICHQEFLGGSLLATGDRVVDADAEQATRRVLPHTA